MALWIVFPVILLSAWMFGAVEGWLALPLAQLLLVAWVFWFIAWGGRRPLPPQVTGLLLPICLLLLLTWLQQVSLPLPVIRVLAPSTAQSLETGRVALYDSGLHEQLRRVADTYGMEPALRALAWAPGSPSASSGAPAATRRSLWMLMSCFAVLLVAATSVKRWQQIESICKWILLSGFCLAFLGILVNFTGSDKIFWFHEPRYTGAFFGPFSNRNHFAAYMNLCFAAGFGLLLSSKILVQSVGWPAWRERLSWFSSRGGSEVSLNLFALFLVGSGMCLSLSRGGMISLLVAMGLSWLFACRWLGRGDRRRLRMFAIMLLVAAGVMWLGWEPVMMRLATLRDVARSPWTHERGRTTLDTLELFGANPLFGTGLGGFRHTFPAFQRVVVPRRYLHAENDWAQLLAEGGVLIAAVFFWLLFMYCRAVYRGFVAAGLRQRMMILGLVTGLLAIAVHSFFDFSLRRPSVAYLFCFLSGIVLSACRLAPGGLRREAAGPPRRAGAWVWLAWGLGLLIVPVFYQQHQAWRGELAFARVLHAGRLLERTGYAPYANEIVVRANEDSYVLAHHLQSNADGVRETCWMLFSWIRQRQLPGEVALTIGLTGRDLAMLGVLLTPGDYLAWLTWARAAAAVGLWDEVEVCLDQASSLAHPAIPIRLFRDPRNHFRYWNDPRSMMYRQDSGSSR